MKTLSELAATLVTNFGEVTQGTEITEDILEEIATRCKVALQQYLAEIYRLTFPTILPQEQKALLEMVEEISSLNRQAEALDPNREAVSEEESKEKAEEESLPLHVAEPFHVHYALILAALSVEVGDPIIPKNNRVLTSEGGEEHTIGAGTEKRTITLFQADSGVIYWKYRVSMANLWQKFQELLRNSLPTAQVSEQDIQTHIHSFIQAYQENLLCYKLRLLEDIMLYNKIKMQCPAPNDSTGAPATSLSNSEFLALTKLQETRQETEAVIRDVILPTCYQETLKHFSALHEELQNRFGNVIVTKIRLNYQTWLALSLLKLLKDSPSFQEMLKVELFRHWMTLRKRTLVGGELLSVPAQLLESGLFSEIFHSQIRSFSPDALSVIENSILFRKRMLEAPDMKIVCKRLKTEGGEPYLTSILQCGQDLLASAKATLKIEENQNFLIYYFSMSATQDLLSLPSVPGDIIMGYLYQGFKLPVQTLSEPNIDKRASKPNKAVS